MTSLADGWAAPQSGALGFETCQGQLHCRWPWHAVGSHCTAQDKICEEIRLQ